MEEIDIQEIEEQTKIVITDIDDRQFQGEQLRQKILKYCQQVKNEVMSKGINRTIKEDGYNQDVDQSSVDSNHPNNDDHNGNHINNDHNGNHINNDHNDNDK